MRFSLFVITILLTSFAYAKSIDYSSGGKVYEGYYLSAGKKAPTILLLHDWDGLTDYEIKRSKMLKKLGYSVFAADLFGKGIRPVEVTDKKQHTGELYQDREKMRRLIIDAIENAKKQGLNTTNLAVMGYCFGGAAVLELARSGYNAKGFFSFHGGLQTPEGQSYKSTKGTVVVYHGTSDSMISMDEFAELAKELETQKVSHEMLTFGGAPHAFTVFGIDNYRKHADKKSWQHFTATLKELL